MSLLVPKREMTQGLHTRKKKKKDTIYISQGMLFLCLPSLWVLDEFQVPSTYEQVE